MWLVDGWTIATTDSQAFCCRDSTCFWWSSELYTPLKFTNTTWKSAPGKDNKKQNSTWNSHFYPFFRFHSFNFWAVYSTMWQPKDASCHREAGLFGIDQSHGTLGGSNWGSAGGFYFPDTQCIHYLPTWMVKICGKCRKQWKLYHTFECLGYKI